MALLKIGSKAPVFVTHLEFVGKECQIFCQVGDVGGQADTLAERVADVIENGHASPVSQCSVGSLCLALFNEDNSWYRARVLQNLGKSVQVFFIDYGNTETVLVNNIREAPDYVLAIPALTTKCIVADCAPLGDVWVEEEKKKRESMLHSGEFTCEVVGSDKSDVNNEVYIVKLFSLDAPNTPIFVRPATGGCSLKPQALNCGQGNEVFVAFVDNAKKFWVQLKSQEKELESLMNDIRACFAEDLPSTGDIMSPVNEQVCAACFSDDGEFYRGLVQNVQGDKCTVFFVDYGNNEQKSTSELFTLPQALCKFPSQAILCSYKGDGSKVEDKLHELTSAESPSVLRVVSGNPNSGYVVEIDSVEKSLGRVSSQPQTVVSAASKSSPSTKLWQSYTSVIMQVDSIYDVCLSHIDHPGQFFVQLLGNAKNLDTLMQAIDEVAHNYDKLTNLYAGYQCLAKFSDESWYRAEVVAVADCKITVVAVDFGFSETLPPSNLRNTDPNFKLQPAQAIKCSIDVNKTEQSMWTPSDISKFKALADKTALVAKVTARKGLVYQLDLYISTDNSEQSISAQFLGGESKPKTVASPKGPSFQQTATPAIPQTNLGSPEVSIGSQMTLCFTAAKVPYVYGQVTNTPVAQVAKLQIDLNTFFEKNAGEMLAGARVGSICCTKYVDDGWYRGMITTLTGSQADVAFVDFGDSVKKSVQDLKRLPSNLCSLPQQCLLCKIDNIPDSVPQDKLAAVLVNSRVAVKFTRKENSLFPTYGVEIVDRQVLDKLQDKPAQSQGVFKGASSRTFGRPPRDEQPRGDSGFGRDSASRRPSGDAFNHQGASVGATEKVMVTYVNDPGNFQVVQEQFSDKLDEVMDQLHEYYDKLGPGVEQLENPKLGQPCVAQFTEDKGWYRAKITGLKSNGQAEVMYVDYGNTEYTEREALKSIKKEYMTFPSQAIQCTLSGVASPQGFWSPEHSVQFSEMIEEQSFTATFKSQHSEQGQTIFRVELVDKKGINVNQKFGSMTNTVCADGGGPRSVSTSSGFGSDMKVTVNSESTGWDDSGSSGGRSSGFGGGGKPSSSFGGGGGGGSFGSRGGASSGGSGFGSGGGGGFGSGGGGGFGSSGGGGFGSGSSSGFGSGGGSSFGSGGGSGFGSGGGSGFGSSGGSGFGGKPSGFGSSSGGFGGGSGGSKDCFKCGEAGHFSRECPNAGNRGGGGRECYKCGESGHMARDCTNPPKAGGGGGGRDCFKCGESGHMARDCTNPPKAGGGGGGRECYKCGEGGHMARDCTNPPKPGGGGGGRDCYKCGESGHMARDCTNPPKEGAGPRRDGGGFGGGGRSSGFGGGDRSSGGGFGGRSGGGGFGSSSGGGNENWGNGSSSTGGGSGFGSKGGFGARGGSGGGFGGERSESGGSGFGSRGGGGFGGKPGGGFGGGGQGFDKRGGGDGGFGNRGGGGGFGSTKPSAGEDDWGDDASPVPQPVAGGFGQKASPAGDATMTRVGKDELVFRSLAVNVRDTMDVYVVFTTNPEQFWCQVIKNCPSLEELMEQMNTFYNGLPEGDIALQRPEIGMPCAAKFAEDNLWYRAEVMTPGQLEVEVQFVDYGNTQSISASQLKKLKPEFLKLPTQGLKCGLDSVVPVNNAWSQKALEDFEDLTIDKHLVAKSVNRGAAMTYLLDLENVEDKVNIVQTMCDKGHCTISAINSSPVKEKIVQNPYKNADIKVGSEVDVYISWIEDPEQFWVQPASAEDHLVELVEKIQEIYTTGSGKDLKPSTLQPGQQVVALFSDDGAWYRGYVEKAMETKCKVRFVDYGNADIVAKESLRLPTEDLMNENSQAAMCKLISVRPLQSGQYSADARDIFDGLVQDVTVKCTVCSVKDGHFSVELKSKGVDVKQELIKAAVLKAEKEPSPISSSVSKTSSNLRSMRYPHPVQPSVGTTEAVYIAHTDSVASFWCQFARLGPQLDDIMAKLEEHCKSGTEIGSFHTDMPCAAKFSADEQWYRAQVTATYPDSVEVLFVDYGNTEKVATSDICLLTDELLGMPPQAVQCELENSGKASNQLTTKFIELVEDKEVQAIITDVQDNIALVRLTLPTGDIGETLGLASPRSTAPSSPPKTATSSAPNSTECLSYVTSKLPSSSSVFVSNTISPGEFYVQRSSEESQLDELMAQVTQHCESAAASGIDHVMPGMACCSKFSEDNAWYRARVEKVDGQNVKVLFVDYGNSENTPIDKLKNISVELVKTPLFAYFCGLSGVESRSGVWSDESIAKFEELTIEKELQCEAVSDSLVILKGDDETIADLMLASEHVVKVSDTMPKNIAFNFSNNEVPTDPCQVYVSHINTPSDFYIQLVDQEERLNTLMEKLTEAESSLRSGSLSCVSAGQAVCSRFSEDQALYRAKVVEVDGEKVTVLFVDYGNSEATTVDKLMNLNEDLLIDPPFAIQCGLAKVVPVKTAWSDKSFEYLGTVTADKQLTCEFIGSSHVKLKSDDGDIVDGLIENGHAQRVNDVPSPCKVKGHFMPQSIPADSVTGFVSHLDNDGTMYIQLACEEDILNKVVEDVQALESTPAMDIACVRRGDNVCARFSEDQSWYRAEVLSVDGDSLNVRFVDYGNCDTVKQSSDLRLLSEQFFATPALAYVCCLSKCKNMASTLVEQLSELTKDKELTVTFLTSSPVYDVELQDENQCDVAAALQTDTDEQFQIQEEVVTQTEALQQESSTVDVESSPKTEGSPATNVPEVDLDEMATSLDDLTFQQVEEGQRVNVHVSFSESPSQLWVQLQSEKQPLEELLNTMFDFYSAVTDDRLTVKSVQKDEVVAALYSEDESWYRAKVVSWEKSDVTVMFLDHGNTEVVMVDSLRKLPVEFCQLSVQGIECCLGAVQPSDGDWSDEAKECFTEATQNKTLLMDVASKTDTGVWKIQLLDMGMSVGEKLVQQGDIGVELATPVAVSTKVKQVFSPDTSDAVITRLYDAKSSGNTGKYGYETRDLAVCDPTITSHNVVVTVISSPGDFWCRLQDNSYEFYQDRLQESYKGDKQLLNEIIEDAKCVVCSNNQFHRATIVNKVEDCVCVKLVDIGSDIDTDPENLFVLKPDFDEHPQLAFQCCLGGVSPVDSEEWMDDACKVFKDIILELNETDKLPTSAKATIVLMEEEIAMVELSIDRMDLTEHLVAKGVANILENVDLSMNESNIRERTLHDLADEFGAFKNVILDMDKDYEVDMIDCDDMERLVFHTKEGTEVNEGIANAVAEFVEGKTGGEGLEEDFTTGPCLAKCPQDDLWYRANLIKLQAVNNQDPDRKYQVFLVDYGSTFYMEKSSLLPIPDSLLEKPGQAIVCTLAEIEPVDGVWSDECQSFFQDQYTTEDKDLLIYVNSYCCGCHEVVLSSKDQTDKSANYLLAELGLAMAVVGSQVEMSMLADTVETSFHEVSMSRLDSLSGDDEQGETSFKPDSFGLVDTSHFTEGDTSCLTEGDTSCLTEGDTSCLTEGDTSCLTEGDTSCLTEGDTSNFTEGDTSCLTEGDTTGFTETDTSCITEGDTTGVTESEGDTSVNTLDGTHWVCEDCECENNVDESIMECLHCHKVRTEFESVAIQELAKGLIPTHGNVCEEIEELHEEPVNRNGEFAEDIHGKLVDSGTDHTDDVTVAVAEVEDCIRTLIDFSTKRSKTVIVTNVIFEESKIAEGISIFEVVKASDGEKVLEMDENGNITFEEDNNNNNNVKPADKELNDVSQDLKTDKTSHVEAGHLSSENNFEAHIDKAGKNELAAEMLDKPQNYVKQTDRNEDIEGNNKKLKAEEQGNITSELDESVESATDYPRSTEESDLDMSYYLRYYDSPTMGYYTSELDETTDTWEFDTTGLTDFNTTGIEGGGEDMSHIEFEEDKINYSDELVENVTEDDNDVLKSNEGLSENVLVEINDVQKDGRLNIENEVGEQCKIKEGKVEETADISDQQRSLSEYMYPSVSDTTYPSTLTSVSDYTFTSAYDTSQTDSMIVCDDCKSSFSVMSSTLDTTDCESEFSYYVCSKCHYRKLSRGSESICNNEKFPTHVDELNTREKENARMVEVANEVFADDEHETSTEVEKTENEDENGNEIVRKIEEVGKIVAVDINEDDDERLAVRAVNDEIKDETEKAANNNEEDNCYEVEMSKKQSNICEVNAMLDSSEERVNLKTEGEGQNTGTLDLQTNEQDVVVKLDEENMADIKEDQRLPIAVSPSGTDVDKAFDKAAESKVLRDEVGECEVPFGEEAESEVLPNKADEFPMEGSAAEKQSFMGKFISMVIPILSDSKQGIEKNKTFEKNESFGDSDNEFINEDNILESSVDPASDEGEYDTAESGQVEFKTEHPEVALEVEKQETGNEIDTSSNGILTDDTVSKEILTDNKDVKISGEMKQEQVALEEGKSEFSGEMKEEQVAFEEGKGEISGESVQVKTYAEVAGTLLQRDKKNDNETEEYNCDQIESGSLKTNVEGAEGFTPGESNEMKELVNKYFQEIVNKYFQEIMEQVVADLKTQFHRDKSIEKDERAESENGITEENATGKGINGHFQDILNESNEQESGTEINADSVDAKSEQMAEENELLAEEKTSDLKAEVTRYEENKDENSPEKTEVGTEGNDETIEDIMEVQLGDENVVAEEAGIDQKIEDKPQENDVDSPKSVENGVDSPKLVENGVDSPKSADKSTDSDDKEDFQDAESDNDDAEVKDTDTCDVKVSPEKVKVTSDKETVETEEESFYDVDDEEAKASAD